MIMNYANARECHENLQFRNFLSQPNYAVVLLAAAIFSRAFLFINAKTFHFSSFLVGARRCCCCCLLFSPRRERVLLANIRNSDKAELFQFHGAMKLFEQVKVGGRFSISRISKEEILIPQKKTWKSFLILLCSHFGSILRFLELFSVSIFFTANRFFAFFYQPTWQNISWSHWRIGLQITG